MNYIVLLHPDMVGVLRDITAREKWLRASWLKRFERRYGHPPYEPIPELGSISGPTFVVSTPPRLP